MGTDRVLIESRIGEILALLGLGGPHFDETPRRVASLLEAFTHQEVDLVAILKSGFESNHDNMMVIQTNIPFKGLCAHHLVPFWGEAAIGYLPKTRVVGLSKLARLVTAAGERMPSTQETITSTIADVLWKGGRSEGDDESNGTGLNSAGVAVVSRAWHGCMAVRGPNVPRAQTVISAMRGAFVYSPNTKDEFLNMVNLSWK